jgi:hypothetical protein
MGSGEMSRTSIRLWFCLAAAIVAAAIADPLLEWASNAGLFGSGAYTDHSNVDVLPALLAGVLFVVAHVSLRVRRALALSSRTDIFQASGVALRAGVLRLLPVTFAIQLLALYTMESLEQASVTGHVLGGTVWLGGPVLVSLLVHAIACVGVTYALSRVLRACARTTLHVIHLIRAMAVRPLHEPSPISLRRLEGRRSHTFVLVPRNRAERAPPVPAV